MDQVCINLYKPDHKYCWTLSYVDILGPDIEDFPGNFLVLGLAGITIICCLLENSMIGKSMFK